MLLNALLGPDDLATISLDRVQFDALETMLEREIYTNEVIRKELTGKIQQTVQLLNRAQRARFEGRGITPIDTEKR